MSGRGTVSKHIGFLCILGWREPLGQTDLQTKSTAYLDN